MFYISLHSNRCFTLLYLLLLYVGVDSVVKHDTLINGGDPDSAIVESEANKIAQSAARAMRDSYRHCNQMSPQWGQPTWTGLHGTAGAPR